MSLIKLVCVVISGNEILIATISHLFGVFATALGLQKELDVSV